MIKYRQITIKGGKDIKYPLRLPQMQNRMTPG
jgi:hypothetical protein